jgi:hypothetical protein
MATENSPLPATALGDSWVISGSDETNSQERRNNSLHIDSSSQEVVVTSLSQEPPLTPLSSFSESEFLADYEDPAPVTSQPDISDSTVSISSSGPELVMPSIMFESKSTNNGSWVIPKKRSKQRLYESRKAPKMPKHRSPSPDEQPSTAVSEAAPVPRPASGVKQRLGRVKRHLDQKLNQNNLFRILLNSFFLFMTLHLLVIPEILYQVPSLCQVSAASKLYTKQCSRFNETSSTVPGIPTKFQSTLRTQNQLHDYLNHTIQAITPLEKPLKDSDAVLRQLYTSVRTEYSGARNEIDLEFQGIWDASRSISRDFMTLKVDVEGFINNIQSQKTLSDHQRLARDTANSKTHFLWRLLFSSRDIPEAEKQEANGLALTNQFTRLNQDLDTTIARLSQKAESFLLHLAKVDDHLESMKAVLVREQQRIGQNSHDFNQVDGVWDTLRGIWSGSSDSAGGKPTLDDNKNLSELERMSSYHGLIADIIGKFDNELKALQKIRSIQA